MEKTINVEQDEGLERQFGGLVEMNGEDDAPGDGLRMGWTLTYQTE